MSVKTLYATDPGIDALPMNRLHEVGRNSYHTSIAIGCDLKDGAIAITLVGIRGIALGCFDRDEAQKIHDAIGQGLAAQ